MNFLKKFSPKIFSWILLTVFVTTWMGRSDRAIGNSEHDAGKIRTAEAAAHAFDQGQFPESARLFEELIGSGITNGHLYYNLGNAYFRSGKVGEAAAALLASRRYLPRDPDVQANLKHVMGQISDKLEPATKTVGWQSLLFWVDWVTPRELTVSASILAAASGAFWLLFLIVGHSALRGAAFVGIFCSMAAAAAAVGTIQVQERWGAVVAESASVTSQPSSSATAVFVLREGAPFLVAAESPGWYKIQVSDGKSGWVPAGKVRAF